MPNHLDVFVPGLRDFERVVTLTEQGAAQGQHDEASAEADQADSEQIEAAALLEAVECCLVEQAMALEFATVRDVAVHQERERSERSAAIELGTVDLTSRAAGHVMTAQLARTRRDIRRLGSIPTTKETT